MATQNISWTHDLDGALRAAGAERKYVLVDFSAAPMWGGCARLDAEVYPDPRVASLVNDRFVPVRVHVKDQADEFQRLGQRFNAQWTPTALVLDPSGTERHRIEGFLPADDFLGQLTLGLARTAFATGDFREAERRYREVVDRYPGTDAAAEALYWAGVSRYKATGDASALGETARQFKDRYQGTSWAKKASVWAA